MNAKTKAIANADSHLNNAGLPTYTELLAALRLTDKALHHSVPTHAQYPETVLRHEKALAAAAICIEKIDA
ncbi:gp38 [Burkholderia phage BcepB1A]|uniref:gp38 n=1 Tax=Burkholderia phage BcepB1A TaxID=279530 RepID=UPI00003779A0|nr:gp38 [Burkholderia phage BcepB1A]AAT37741.1 gp38 [Burkholderia phage BcepB1A]